MSKLKACKTCGHMVAPNAPTCPSCGARNPAGGLTAYRIAQIATVVVGGLFVASIVITPYVTKSEFQKQLDRAVETTK
jgi:hypothetical protein